VIRAEAERRYSISPRAAANIIGFCEFPAGWSWSEYKKDLNEQPQVYEAKAARIRFLDTEPLEPQNDLGREAEQNAQAFRRRHVEHLLNRMIVREEIRASIFDDEGLEHLPSEKLRRDLRSRISIEKSAFGFDAWLFPCLIDAPDLTKLMENERWKGEREKSHDWLLIERRIRNAFDTFGLPRTDQEVFDYILEIQSDKGEHEPTVSTLRNLISDLRAEYEFYDYRRHL
jgi:hypothetical protein